ncbi:MAG: Zn(2+)-responsive transcriptional regulator [Alcanivoracaceae bacterium]|nr:Zn(2+)-responsive transcriptional regulator [Alcanivoracaceae bacterium]
MKIGHLATAVGMDIQTLRYYESQGLLSEPARLQNGYRDYPDEAISRLKFIKKAKLVGFTLKEIKDLLAIQVTKDEHTCQEVKSFTQVKLAEISNKIEELQRIKVALEKIHTSCCGGDETAAHCSILSALEN